MRNSIPVRLGLQDRSARVTMQENISGMATMNFPLSFWDISLFFAVTAIILLVTSELLSPYYGKTNLTLNRKRLRNAALASSTLFLVTVAVKVATMIISP